MKFKQWFWYIISVFIGLGYMGYSIMLLYYNPYYRYEYFLQREWFYLGTIIILGIIFGYIFFSVFHQEKYIDELFDSNQAKSAKCYLLEKENKDLKDQLIRTKFELETLKENSMLKENDSSSVEEPPQRDI